MRNKVIAGILALFLGLVGAPWFYLGRRTRGYIYAIVSTWLFFVSYKMQAPLILIMGLVTIIDTLVLLSMPKEEFDEKYNARYLKRQAQNPRQSPAHQKSPATGKKQAATHPNKAAGIEKFKDYDYDGAIADFKLSLADHYEDAAVHFNLACCYSLLEKPSPAFFHLARAVQFGFIDFDKIETHEALAFLRTQPDFQAFAKNGYQHRSATPPPENGAGKENLKSKEAKEEENLLEQIKRLSDLRNQGILTQEEFLAQTKQVLGR